MPGTNSPWLAYAPPSRYYYFFFSSSSCFLPFYSMRCITSIMLNLEVSSFGGAGSLGGAFSGFCYYFGKGIWGTKSLGIGMTIFVPGITVLGISGSGAFFYCCSLAIGLFFAFLLLVLLVLLALLVLYGALLYIFASFFCSQASLRYSFSTYLSCFTSYLVLT